MDELKKNEKRINNILHLTTQRNQNHQLKIQEQV